ncbi:retrovirus-related pol polyprotein LINE-1 [Tanacetum coccineum]
MKISIRSKAPVTDNDVDRISSLPDRILNIILSRLTSTDTERVIERRLRQETEVSENQFGFMPGRSTMEAIHIIRSLMEKYREIQKDLHLAFLDLEKAYDNVPRELIWRTLSDKGTPT